MKKGLLITSLTVIGAGLIFGAFKLFGKTSKVKQLGIPDEELHRIFKEPFYNQVVFPISGTTRQEVNQFIRDVGDLEPDNDANTNKYPVIAKLYAIRFGVDYTDFIGDESNTKDLIFNPGYEGELFIYLHNERIILSVVYQIVLMS